AQETVGRTGGFLIPEDYRCEAVVSRERISRGELVENFETVRIRKDGARIHVSLTASPIRDEAGKVVGISVISRDVTDKKRFAETLAASNERYRLVSRATSDTIWDWDVLAGTVEWNEGLAATFGYSLGEVEHTPEWWLDRVHEEDRERVGAALEQAIAGGGEFWSDEYRLRRADGSFAFVLDRGYVLRDGEGHPLRMIGSTSDMTARNEAEQELLRAKEVAEDANRAKSEFLSRMSHELRTPLNSVIGFASVLHKNKAGNLREQDRGYLERILANGKHLLGLINDILDLSKIEAGKVEVELAPTALDTLVRDTLTALRGARGPEVDLRMDVPESLAPLEADPGKLKQVLINLVGNALKFTERGVVRVAVSADPLTLRPYRIDVSDTGIGIPADRLAAIFQPFEQAESGTARRFEGTGLGLAICSSLCGLLGYELTVRSEPGVGSTFSIRLGPEPETDASGAASIVFRSSPDDAGEPGAEPLPLAGKRVMVIDDEADACIVLSHYLEECGCDVLATTSATQAIRIAEWFAPDLITLDLMMPARSGVELFEQLKQHPVLGGVPVLVVSVLADQGVGISGVIEMLTKPVSRERLQQTLDRIFEARPVRVLVIDGDSGTREQMALSLEAEGVAVQTAANLSQALGALRSAHPDFVVLNPTPTDEGGAPLFAVTAREPTPAELRRLRENPLAPLRSTDG
ncbi:MAG: PAS domain-containing protein, partial [Gemmatimonadetes bacterium]|nr:PAS domain-containing protein [Gemmatimonadota bacterium]